VSDYFAVGTGTALIPIELCRRASSARVVAIDLAGWMLRLAAANVERAGLGAAISVERADAKALPYEDASFSCANHAPPGSLPVLE
jgi:ubiquinone/menaquinone biosynthesis C-methylase UbiE